MVVNSKFLKNFRVSKQVLRLCTNAGMARVIHEGDMPGVGVCWYYADGIVNVISQAKAVRENGFKIDYSTRKDKNRLHDLTFLVKTKEGVKLKFVPNKKGLHVLNCKSYYDPVNDGCVFGKWIVLEVSKPDVKGVSLVGSGVKVIATIDGNKSNYTNRDVERAEATRQF